jgi:phosphomannomutase
LAGRLLLDQLGVRVIHLNGEATGQFPHAPEPIREHLIELTETVRRERAHLGFAQDPDADRLAIVDENGEYIGEEYTLVIAAESVLGSAAGDRPARGEPIIVTNLSTSRMMDDVAERHGARLIRTAVGEANVVDAMRKHDAVIGGEGNGGVIWPAVCGVRDSISGMALALALLARTQRSLSHLVADWPSYHFLKSKIETRPGLAENALSQLEARFARERIDRTDGIRIDFKGASDSPQGAWLHVRASNTEPILRVLAEAPTEAAANQLVAQVRELLRNQS